MTKMIRYKDSNFRDATLERIFQANKIIAEYAADGYDLTLRQLYYQFVARDIIPNSQREYNKLGVTVSDGRLAGLIDWETIVDRTRTKRALAHFDNPRDILMAAADQYRIDTRADQDYYIEVWVEKDALVGVIERAANQIDVPFLSCRGYVSQSAMWRAGQRLIAEQESGRRNVILHLGDHDPSGIDMTRDISERLEMFGADVHVKRIALNMDQVRQYSPPPNPAKITDSRAGSYIERFGRQSWELDALDPRVLTALIIDQAARYTDQRRIDALKKIQESDRAKMFEIAKKYETII